MDTSFETCFFPLKHIPKTWYTSRFSLLFLKKKIYFRERKRENMQAELEGGQRERKNLKPTLS